jgi:cyanate permease
MIPDRWLMLCVLFLARTAMAYQFQTVGAVGPILVEELSIDFAVLGTIIGLYMLPGVVFALPGGVLGQRFGAKRIVLLGLGFMTVGGTLTTANSFVVLAGGRLISGIGAVLINVMMTKMIADWFAGRKIVTAMSIFIASWPFGLAIGLITFPPLAGTFSWSTVMWAGACVAFACLLLVALIYRDPPGAAPLQASTMRIDLSSIEWTLVSIAGAIWSTYNVGYIVLISFLPELFVTRGYSLADASRIVSLLGWALIPSVPLAGYFADRLFGRPNLLMLGGFATVAAGAIILPFVNAPMSIFAVIVFAIGVPAGLIMALPAQALNPSNRAAGMGIFYTSYYAAMAFLPALAGVTRDVSESASAGAVFASGMMMLAMLGLAAFRVTQRSSSAKS